MSYLTQSLRNAYDTRDRGELERLLLQVEVLEHQGGVVQSAEHRPGADDSRRNAAGAAGPEVAGSISATASQSAWAQVTPK